MCGITGMVVRKGEQVSEGLLREMTGSMIHRGPDEDGIYIDENVGIGMRRLSIMDVVGGSQPLFSNDGNVVMVGNGEIYNFQGLMKELSNLHRFSSATDMEVVAPLYQKYGLDFPNKMEGMFGLAVFDKNAEKLHLIRDQIGIKPLFVAQTDTSIVFSSDINSILKSKKVSITLNQEAVDNYFNYRCGALGSGTFFNGIQSLLPGQILTINTSTLETTYSHFHNSLKFTYQNLSTASESDLVQELDEILRASVSKRLMADVPLGTLLSSGIDSTLLTAMANDISEGEIDTFTIGYSEKSHDESAGAKKSANHIGVPWHLYSVTNKEYTDLLIPGIRMNEAPITHPNSLAVHLITKMAYDNGYKVLLSGEGADELFAGYRRTTDLSLLNGIHQKYPQWILNFLTGFGLKFNPREAGILKALENENNADLLSVYFSNGSQEFMPQKNSPKLLQTLASQINRSQIVNHTLQCEQRTYLQELLLRQDKMSMWSSMEVRVPFVGDPKVIEFANRLPIKWKLKEGVNKYLLRKVAERYLPKHICYERKRGFGSPLSDWLRQKSPYRELAYSLVSSCNMDSDQKKCYSKLLDEHTKKKADHYEIIWKIMNYLLFRKQYGI